MSDCIQELLLSGYSVADALSVSLVVTHAPGTLTLLARLLS